MKKILIIGSLNMDIVLETPRIPKCGETISGKNITQVPGGKGANQAYAIGKLGEMMILDTDLKKIWKALELI